MNTFIPAQTFQLDLSLPESVYDFHLGRTLTSSEVQELRNNGL